MPKERVLLLGGSGTMGFNAFLELWKKREDYDIVLLLLPNPYEKHLFRTYEKQSGITSIPGTGVVKANGFKIVWGDASNYEDVLEAVDQVDWVLNAMAYISPQADYYPQISQAVNQQAVENILLAIKAQPGGAERIRYIHTGSVAETGDRLEAACFGRVGDPLNPSVFDTYAVHKIAGERAVLESGLSFWASLRLTYIIPTRYSRYMQLQDPIMFHMPLASYMENISDRDAGFGLVNVLKIPADSDFWRKVYNMGGGETMRLSAYEYMNTTFQLSGFSGVAAVTERNWFAIRNFHMQYYLDSHICDHYLHYQRDSMQDIWKALLDSMPFSMKLLRFLMKTFKFIQRFVEQRTYLMFKSMLEKHPNGTLYWFKHHNHQRIAAFFKDEDSYNAIPGWDQNLPSSSAPAEWKPLDHGYDETKTELNLSDLKKAAAFRGGECLSENWDGDWYKPLSWRCGFDHCFQGSPYTVLKAGHWCPDCILPPWQPDQQARKNPFFAQVWYVTHDPEEDNQYPLDGLQDIAAAGRKDKLKS